jgi:hypothetical protein
MLAIVTCLCWIVHFALHFLVTVIRSWRLWVQTRLSQVGASSALRATVPPMIRMV